MALNHGGHTNTRGQCRLEWLAAFWGAVRPRLPIPVLFPDGGSLETGLPAVPTQRHVPEPRVEDARGCAFFNHTDETAIRLTGPAYPHLSLQEVVDACRVHKRARLCANGQDMP